MVIRYYLLQPSQLVTLGGRCMRVTSGWAVGLQAGTINDHHCREARSLQKPVAQHSEAAFHHLKIQLLLAPGWSDYVSFRSVLAMIFFVG